MKILRFLNHLFHRLRVASFHQPVTWKKLLFCIILILSTQVVANSSHYPRGCEVSGFHYYNSKIYLAPSFNQAFYLIQNRSTSKILMRRPLQKLAILTPNFENLLTSLKWSALAVDVEGLEFECILDSTQTAISCDKVIEVCQYPRVQVPLSSRGTYWAATDQTLQEVIAQSVLKGIYLHW